MLEEFGIRSSASTLPGNVPPPPPPPPPQFYKYKSNCRLCGMRGMNGGIALSSSSRSSSSPNHNMRRQENLSFGALKLNVHIKNVCDVPDSPIHPIQKITSSNIPEGEGRESQRVCWPKAPKCIWPNDLDHMRARPKAGQTCTREDRAKGPGSPST